jgi:hypothetical protein
MEPAKKKRSTGDPSTLGGSPDARKVAAAILDVLGGMRTPTTAAQAVGVSLPRYYALESRAIEGLVKACEPRPKGRAVLPDKDLAGLRKQVEQLKRECERRQALLRAAQRTVGLSLPEPKPGKRWRRKPVVRALKVAAVLRSEPAAAVPSGGEDKG